MGPTRRWLGWSLGLLAACLPLGCDAPERTGDSAIPDTAGAPEPTFVDPALLDALSHGPARALLRVDDQDIERMIAQRRTRADLAGDRPELVAARAEAWALRAASLVGTLPPGVRVERVYTHIPVVVVQVADRASADALARRPDVRAVDADALHEAFLTESLALINQPAAAASGFTGAGTAVAVLDTGADWTVSDLGSCTAVGTPSTCRVAYAADFAASDGARDDSTGHGTNVSAIVAQVATGTDILALDVFSGSGASSTDILSAIDWVIANAATYNVAAINMSLGAGAYTATCSSAFGSGVSAARAAGIAVVAASGNNAYTNAIASPACEADAFSVGAVYDASFGGVTSSACSDASTAADQVTCFSNSASFLDLLAPGAFVTAGGRSMAGTSQAAPHVAGAFAVLRAADAGASVDELEDRLRSSGTSVTDARNGLAFPRLDLEAAVADCVTGLSDSAFSVDGAGGSGSLTVSAPSTCSWSVSSTASWLSVSPASGTGTGVVTWSAASNSGAARSATITVSGRAVSVTQSANAGPSGSVTIAAGATGTRTTAVTLTLSASDGDGVGTMCISNSTSCSSWETYSASKSWTLSSSGTTKTVYATFRDALGNTGSTVSDTIVYDTTAPTNGSVTGTGSSGAAALSWSGFTDAGSGVSSYKVVYGTSTPSSACASGTSAYTGSATSTTIAGLTDGTTYTFRVCAVDGAGNTSTGATVSVRPAPEYDAPVGSISLAGGAAWTRSTSVTATLSASDASGVSYMCVGTSSSCTTYVAYASSRSVSLTSGAGTKTAYAVFKDAYGNVASAVSDTIGYDATAPTNGTLSASASSGAVTLTWSGFSDATSGLASYTVVQGTGSAPSSCSAGTSVYSGTATSTTVSGLTDGTTYGFRVCALDVAGNTSTGASTTSIPTPETSAPTGTITLNSGAAWTTSSTVTAALSATDASGVASMCVGTSSSCTTFSTYATTKSVSIGTTAGTRTVYAVFKDTYGNVGATVSDTIAYDGTKPTNGTLTATASSGQVALSWTGFSDAGSGLSGYTVVYASSTAPSACTSGTTAYTGTGTSTTITGLTDGTTYGFRVCATDVAGNLSSGASTTARPAPEYTAPTGTIELGAGAAYTGSSTVSVALSASDASGVSRMCISTSTTCSSWTAYATSTTTSVGSSDGTRTVRAWFEDAYGNQSATAASDTIILDRTAPTNGTLSVTASTGALALGWSGYSDAGSGIASYKVVYASSSTASACSSGTTAYSGTSTSTTIAGLPSGTPVYLRVCAVDAMGNTSSGRTGAATPL